MRNGSSPATSSTDSTGTPSSVSLDGWRAHMRSLVLEGLAEGTEGLTWTNELLTALLEELHVTEEFEQLAGPLPRNAKRDAARLLAIALFLRHSWDPADLDTLVDRVLFRACEIDVVHPSSKHGDRGHRHLPVARTSPSGPRARKELP
jgi:hypothetical protein